MRRQIEGSKAVAETVALCRPAVVAAYPITPQTHIVEGLGAMVKSGALPGCEFVNVESEFAAMSVASAPPAAGARAYTATASQGLLFMAEALYNASGLGLPIVMTVANRAIGAPINIWNDHSDSMSQRDSGWIQLYAETNQEAMDLHVQAFRLAEELSVPVMVCMDGFVLTHAVEPLEVPGQAEVDAFLPPFSPRQVLDPAEPVSIGAMVGPEAFTEVRYLQAHSQLEALDTHPRGRRGVPGRVRPGLRRAAPPLPQRGRSTIVLVVMGSVLGTAEGRRRRLPARRGRPLGVVGITSFRPWPIAAVREALRGIPRAGDRELERAFSVGAGSVVGQRDMALAGSASAAAPGSSTSSWASAGARSPAGCGRRGLVAWTPSPSSTSITPWWSDELHFARDLDHDAEKSCATSELAREKKEGWAPW